MILIKQYIVNKINFDYTSIHLSLPSQNCKFVRTYYVQECTKVLSLLGIIVGLRNVTV